MKFNLFFKTFITLSILITIFTYSDTSIAQSKTKFPGINYYVSQKGNDHFSGTWEVPVSLGTDGPFETLKRARDFVREQKEGNLHPDGGINIVIRGGTYFIDEPFTFTSADTGTPVSPVTIKAYKNEKVILSGGIELKPSWFTSVRDENILSRLPEKVRRMVLQVNLREQGITDYGVLHSRTNWRNDNFPAPMELFYKGEPMQVARWPNEDWLKISTVPADNATGSFFYSGDRPSVWLNTEGLMVHGYWKHNWSESYELVESLNTETKEVKTVAPHGPYGYAPGSRYYFLNILEELDRPGEYFIDRTAGILYFVPPGKIEPEDVYVSISETPILVLEDVSSFTISNIIFENSRGDGIVINGGTMNVVAGCEIRNLGGIGVRIEGGRDNGIRSSEIYNTGAGAVKIDGGDRKNLTSSRNFARNNNIYKYGRLLRTASPGISMSGVGIHAAWNRIHNAPHEAISFHGNENIIERNEIYDVLWKTSDAGAVYIGRNWTERGNLIRNNFFHHLQGMYGYGASPDGNGVNAVYLDDMASGNTVFGNIFYKAGRCVLIGGGRDNIISNNIFIECAPSAVHIDSRATSWAADSVKEDGVMMNRLKEIDIRHEPYSTRYPALANILQNNPALPLGNVIKFNIVTNSKFMALINTDISLVKIFDNFNDSDPGYKNIEGLDFSIFDDSLVYKLGFTKIPFEGIGLQLDEYRTVIPERDSAYLERNK